jgi:hypothetical protein
MRAVGTAVLLLLAPVAASGQGSDTRCVYSKRTVCDAAGCRALPPQDAFILLPTFPLSQEGSFQVRICDTIGCDAFMVEVQPFGDPLRLSAPAIGYQLVIAREKTDTFTLKPLRGLGLESMKLSARKPNDFVEVHLLMGDVTLLGKGSCPGLMLPPRG